MVNRCYPGMVIKIRNLLIIIMATVFFTACSNYNSEIRDLYANDVGKFSLFIVALTCCVHP